jgi:hypothetical protein
MKDLVVSRRQVLKGASAFGVLGALGIPTTAFAGDEQVELLRWDLVDFPQGVALPGQNFARDNASGDVVTLTGSGEVEPKKGTATGGGTFVHKHSGGGEVAHGVYTVTGFRSFTPAGGTLVGSGLTDGIGTLAQTMGGLLALDVTLMRSGGGSLPGVLEVDCDLSGEFPIDEGVNLSVGAFNFVKQPGSFTLVHVLRGLNQTN